MNPKSAIETDAFVLRTVDYGDHDVIVMLLGEQTGKFSAMARGAKRSNKRFGGALLPMRTIRANVTFKPNSDLARLNDATVVSDFHQIETSYDKITIASYFTELVRECTKEGDDSEEPYNLLRQGYHLICDAEDSVDILRVMLLHLELSLLQLVGHAPSLQGCHRCLKPWQNMEKLRCARTGEGLVCSDCRTDRERYGVLSKPTLELLQFASAPSGSAPPSVADSDALEQARRVIDASLDTVLDRRPKSRALLDQVFL